MSEQRGIEDDVDAVLQLKATDVGSGLPGGGSPDGKSIGLVPQ
ncbi:hypothetical protein [Bradyrhizobium sp. CCGB01]|nr:hypothetical protein [Bradyrhizobium sp. CCGB01]